MEHFDDVVEAKVNLPNLLRNELAKKKNKGVMGFGAMSDPWTKAERKMRLTRQCLEVLNDFSWPVHLTTKSDLCLDDIELLSELAKRNYCCVNFTLTTTDDVLAKIIEPNAPLPSQRISAMKQLHEAGIKVGTIMTPVLPFIEDNEDNILQVIRGTHKASGTFCIGFIGMTMRDRQRVYFYNALDKHFPGIRRRYEKAYGDNYSCSPPDHQKLTQIARNECNKLGLIFDMKDFSFPGKDTSHQTSFL